MSGSVRQKSKYLGFAAKSSLTDFFLYSVDGKKIQISQIIIRQYLGFGAYTNVADFFISGRRKEDTNQPD